MNAVPGVAPTGDLLSAWYLYKHPEGMEWGVYYTPTNFSLFNSKELNTSDVNSAIESYESPRVYRDRYIYSSDITELANKSSDVASFFLDAITNKNYVQNSVWNGLTSSQVSFGSANAFGRVICDQEDYSTGLDWVTIKFNAGAEINNIVSTLCVDMDGDFYVYCGYPQTTYPNLGILLGRAWWSDSAKASTFFQPNPQCYEKAVPAGVVCD